MFGFIINFIIAWAISLLTFLMMYWQFKKYWQDIAAAIDEEDVGKFTEVIKEFDSMTPLVSSNSCQMNKNFFQYS